MLLDDAIRLQASVNDENTPRPLVKCLVITLSNVFSWYLRRTQLKAKRIRKGAGYVTKCNVSVTELQLDLTES